MDKDINVIMQIMQTDAAGVSSKFGIPLRTVYSWVEGVRKPPIYVINMMYNILHMEGMTNGNTCKELET